MRSQGFASVGLTVLLTAFVWSTAAAQTSRRTAAWELSFGGQFPKAQLSTEPGAAARRLNAVTIAVARLKGLDRQWMVGLRADYGALSMRPVGRLGILSILGRDAIITFDLSYQAGPMWGFMQHDIVARVGFGL